MQNGKYWWLSDWTSRLRLQSHWYSALLKQDNPPVRCRQDSRLGSVPRLSGSTLQDPLFEPSTPPCKIILGRRFQRKGLKISRKNVPPGELPKYSPNVPIMTCTALLDNYQVTWVGPVLFLRVACFLHSFFFKIVKLLQPNKTLRCTFDPCVFKTGSAYSYDALRNPSLKSCTFEPDGS